MIRLSEFGKHHCNNHRSGWPYVRSVLQEVLELTDDVTAPYLDDFCEASHVYKPPGPVLTTPWVGIIHHPEQITSPLPGDQKHVPRRSLGLSKSFKASLPALRGVIALSDPLAKHLRSWLKVPVLSLWHPTELGATDWSKFAWDMHGNRLHQLGFFLRDTQAIYRAHVPSRWKISRSSPMHIQWATNRDERLKKRTGASIKQAVQVEQLSRLDNEAYDDLLASSVICNHIFGAAANNVVVECLARATPLVVNPLPAVVQYLGRGYPLYSAKPERWHEVLTIERIVEAHEYLLTHRALMRDKLDAKKFAVRVEQFVEEMCK